MSLTESHTACAERVRQGDPDRFLATMAAPPAQRPALFALYAFNLEIARAPWVAREPLLARMRLQFWRDVLSGEAPPSHDVAPALLALIARGGPDRALLGEMIDAREAEIGTKAPFDTEAQLWRYLEGSAGALLLAATQALAASAGPGGTLTDPARAAVRDLGAAQGLANYLAAVPALAAAGRLPLPDGRPEAVRALAAQGLERLARSRAGLAQLPRPARPALLAAWRARPLLTMALRDPARVAAGRLTQSEFRRRGGLLLRALIGA